MAGYVFAPQSSSPPRETNSGSTGSSICGGDVPRRFVEMGQNSSAPKQPRKRSLRSPFLRRSASQKAPISHTFMLSNENHKIDLLNINLATEEELMTLPGINREIARNIVEYRKAIGRFRKVEDLALVSGIGAEKFENIRQEVCVKLSSCNSSRAQSFDSLRSTESRTTPRPSRRVIDLNRASVFDLQCVHGMSQEMAANIVHYRLKKGPFKQVDDLIKIKGIDHLRLSNMRHQLTINAVTRTTSELLTNGGVCNSELPVVKSHRKSSSAPIRLNVSNGLRHSSLNDIFELLSAYSSRPVIPEAFRNDQNRSGALRVATWNLHQFTLEKAQNLGVKEVICRTILENRWSIVCLQEIEEKEALECICDELNNPALRRIVEWKQNSKDWNYYMLEPNLGFLYDAQNQDIEIELKSLRDVQIQEYKATLVRFQTGSLDLQVLNVQLPEKFPVGSIAVDLKEVVNQDDCFILLGDFTNLSNVAASTSLKKIGGLEAVLPLNTNTTFSSLKFRCSDNIFVNHISKVKLTGLWGVVKQGLTHMAIPNGWSWGGPASPHCPLWAEFNIKQKEDEPEL